MVRKLFKDEIYVIMDNELEELDLVIKFFDFLFRIVFFMIDKI